MNNNTLFFINNTEGHFNKETIKSFAKNIENYSIKLSPREKEILCLMILSLMDPLTKSKWVLSNKLKDVFFASELDLLDKLVERYSNK